MSEPELEALRELAHHYERVMGIARHVVVWTSPPRIRRRYRFIVAESRHLEALASTLLDQLGTRGADHKISLQAQDAMAFWGRVLSSLNLRRGRRRLPIQALEVREQLNAKFISAFLEMMRADLTGLEELLKTRPKREVEWMRSELKL